MKKRGKVSGSAYGGGAAGFLVLMILFGMFGFGPSKVFAAGAGAVVINEVAWAGTADSAYDEWIELYNTTNQSVDLTGWKMNNNNGAAVYNLSGSIAANGYYLIEDSEASVNPNTANLVVNISLPNAGVSLVLFDSANNEIDAVNKSGAAWFSGNSTSKATMERKEASVSGDLASNWATYGGAGGPAVGSKGSVIMGTPGALNSAGAPPVLAQKLNLQVSSASPGVGDVLTVTAKVENVSALFSYGLELDYDPAVLSFVSAGKGSFLNESEGVETSFHSGLADDEAGKLLVAEARMVANKIGVSGDGTLFTVVFNVISAAGGGGSGTVGGSAVPSLIGFGAGSFLAGPAADLVVQMSGASFTPLLLQADPVTDLQVVAGTVRYSIKLGWKAPAAGADKYLVYRKDAHDVWKPLGETTLLEFTDSDSVIAGGKIIPQIDYHYQIKALKGAVESSAVEGFGKEIRGLKGDNNRTDRVDGRDLEKLARHFAESDGDAGFDALADTTYDGQINGSDLIDLGVNFARVY